MRVVDSVQSDAGRRGWRACRRQRPRDRAERVEGVIDDVGGELIALIGGMKEGPLRRWLRVGCFAREVVACRPRFMPPVGWVPLPEGLVITVHLQSRGRGAAKMILLPALKRANPSNLGDDPDYIFSRSCRDVPRASASTISSIVACLETTRSRTRCSTVPRVIRRYSCTCLCCPIRSTRSRA